LSFEKCDALLLFFPADFQPSKAARAPETKAFSVKPTHIRTYLNDGKFIKRFYSLDCP
jgi:hypothetical protein